MVLRGSPLLSAVMTPAALGLKSSVAARALVVLLVVDVAGMETFPLEALTDGGPRGPSGPSRAAEVLTSMMFRASEPLMLAFWLPWAPEVAEARKVWVGFCSVPVVPPKAALLVAPEGEIVEQLSGDPVERAV